MPSFLGAPIAILVPVESKTTILPLSSLAFSPSISAPIIKKGKLFIFTVLLFCELETAFPLASKILFWGIVTVRVSSPFAKDDRPTPNKYVLPILLIDDGVVLNKFAVPPETDKTKSLVSKAPIPELVL